MEGKVIESTRDEESRSVDLEDPPAPASDRVLRIGLAQEDEGFDLPCSFDCGARKHCQKRVADLI